MSRAKPGKPSRRSVMRRSSCSRGGIAAWSGCHDPPASTRNALEGGAVNAPTRIDRIPDWPAMMTRQLAADYCCLSIAQFEREIVSGRLPAPVNRSEEHTSELQSLMRISYAVFCLKKKKENTIQKHNHNHYN